MSRAEGPQPLAPGARAERAFVPPGAIHEYSLEVPPDVYVRVGVRPRASDVAVALRGSSGPLAEVDDDWTGGGEELEWVGGPEAACRIEVRNKRPSVAAVYELQVSEARPATPADRDRVAAARARWQGRELLREQKAERTREALTAFEEALRLSRAAGDPRGEALALGGLGAAEAERTDFPAAIERFLAALGLWQRLGDRRQEVSALVGAGDAFQKLGRQDEALECSEQARSIAGEEGDVEGEAQAFVQLAVVRWGRGESAPALAATEEALARTRTLGHRKIEADALANLALIEMARREWDRALDVVHRALVVSRELNSRLLEAINLNNLGLLYNNLGEPRRARLFLEPALALCRELGNRAGEAIVLNGLGASYRSEGDYALAAQYFEQALPIRRETGDRGGEARTLGALAILHTLRGDSAQARSYYERSLAIREAQDWVHSSALVGLAALALDEGDLEGARELASRALSLAGHSDFAVSALHQLARLAKAGGDLAEAEALGELVLETLDSRRTGLQSADGRALMRASVRDYYDFHVGVLMDLHAAHPGAGLDARAFQAAERARARGLLDLLVESRADVREGVEPGLLQRERALREQLGKASAGMVRARAQGAPALAALEREMESLAHELERVEAEIRTRSPRYASLTQPEPVAVEAVQALLDDDTLLLEYALGTEVSYAWLVGRRSLASIALPGREAIETASRRALEAMESDRADAHAAAVGLSRLVLGPLAERLSGRRLVVVADGALLYVPFAALPHPRDGAPLLVHQEVVNLPSASTLAVLRGQRPPRPPASRTVAVLADPVFDAADERLVPASRGPATDGAAPARVSRAAESIGLSGPIPRLPFTRREAQAILAGVPKHTALAALDFEASRATVMDPKLAQYRVVHLATHGFFNASRPELSGILLSLFDRQGRPQPGFLTAADTFNLKLSADLVVLSGCRTALGREVKGEGIVGLTRGFMYAGADRVLSSLWPVDDAATAALMTRFYSGLFGPSALTPAAALRAAQLDLMKQPRYRHPYFWAAFQLQGEWK